MNEQAGQLEELDIRAYLRPIWRRKWILLAIVLVAAAATYVISSRQSPEYTATAQLYVQEADPTVNLNSSAPVNPPSTQQIADVAQLVSAQSVTNAVARQIGMPVKSAGTVTVSPSSDSDFVTVTATSHSPALAARLANGYVNQFLRARRQTMAAEARRDAAAARATLATLPPTQANSDERRTVLDQIAGDEQMANNPTAGAQLVDPALVPRLPSSPRPKRDALFGAAIGLVLGILVTYGLELLDRRLTRVASVEAILGRPVLAVLPHVEDPAPRPEGGAPVVPAAFLEELRSLRVMLRLSGGKQRLIMVTSALPREGKSTLVRDLALVYAEAGERVLVIEADLRRPSLARLFGIEPEWGLLQVLRGEVSPERATQRALSAPSLPLPVVNGNGSAEAAGESSGAGLHPDRGGGVVDVLAAGGSTDNPVGLLGSERMEAVLAQARQAYSVVLLDSAPVLTVADNVAQMEQADAVLLVTRLGQLTRESARRFNDVVGRLSGVQIAGVIVNDLRDRTEDGGYGSYGRYGYGYYAAKQPSGRKASAPVAS